MTEAEFETRLREMAKAGGHSSSDDLEGMAVDIDAALERVGFDAVKVKKTGDPDRMLSVRAKASGQSLEDVRRLLHKAFDGEIRYLKDSLCWSAVEGDRVRFRFGTRGMLLWATGEIVGTFK